MDDFDFIILLIYLIKMSKFGCLSPPARTSEWIPKKLGTVIDYNPDSTRLLLILEKFTVLAGFCNSSPRIRSQGRLLVSQNSFVRSTLVHKRTKSTTGNYFSETALEITKTLLINLKPSFK